MNARNTEKIGKCDEQAKKRFFRKWKKDNKSYLQHIEELNKS